MSPLEYPDTVIPSNRYQFCPLCKTRLIRKVLFDDNIPMVTCPECHWIYTQSNITSVVSVLTCAEGIVAILPPDLPPETPAALPAGVIEYGESPDHGALREIREETGLEAEIVRSLGWVFVPYFGGWPGPMVQFMYEARVIGGALRGSQEGEAKIFPLQAFPGIVYPERTGSWKAIHAYLSGGSHLLSPQK
jgi:ADP-ribose pyrophosphatase YjhB (NUDIX family)